MRKEIILRATIRVFEPAFEPLMRKTGYGLFTGDVILVDPLPVFRTFDHTNKKFYSFLYLGTEYWALEEELAPSLFQKPISSTIIH